MPFPRPWFAPQLGLWIVMVCAMVARLWAVESADVALPNLVRIWRTDNGLPEDTVRTVAQTPDGYLWIGTAHGGLARFNGMNFERFTTAEDAGNLKPLDVAP